MSSVTNATTYSRIPLSQPVSTPPDTTPAQIAQVVGQSFFPNGTGKPGQPGFSKIDSFGKVESGGQFYFSSGDHTTVERIKQKDPALTELLKNAQQIRSTIRSRDVGVVVDGNGNAYIVNLVNNPSGQLAVLAQVVKDENHQYVRIRPDDNRFTPPQVGGRSANASGPVGVKSKPSPVENVVELQRGDFNVERAVLNATPSAEGILVVKGLVYFDIELKGGPEKLQTLRKAMEQRGIKQLVLRDPSAGREQVITQNGMTVRVIPDETPPTVRRRTTKDDWPAGSKPPSTQPDPSPLVRPTPWGENPIMRLVVNTGFDPAATLKGYLDTNPNSPKVVMLDGVVLQNEMDSSGKYLGDLLLFLQRGLSLKGPAGDWARGQVKKLVDLAKEHDVTIILPGSLYAKTTEVVAITPKDGLTTVPLPTEVPRRRGGSAP